jgi:phosphoribosylglycinamide formyltransferase 1
MYALPFVPRNPRETLFSHRPDQSEAVAPQAIANKHGIPYIPCNSDNEIDNGCDIYLVLGSGILSAKCVEEKKIINCHPGVIPSSRGLDSFKWAIYEMKPLGITLHYIDAAVDAGEIISVAPTNVYPCDSFSTLARRHYENEIDVLSRFNDFLENPCNPFEGIREGDAKKRMPIGIERDLSRMFCEYTEKYGEAKTGLNS